MILLTKNKILILLIKYVLLCLCASGSEAVIYNLDEVQYDQMPPLYTLDDYHTCLHQADGQYCMAFFDLYTNEPNELMTMIQEYSSYTLKHYNHTYIQRGVCVTKTCQKYGHPNKGDLNVILAACLNDSIYQEYGILANLSWIAYCEKSNEPNAIGIIDWAVAVLFGIILMLNLVGSLNENQRNHIKSRKTDVNETFWTHFAIQTNWNNFINTETHNTDLRFIHGLRSLCMIFIIFGHSMWLIYFGYIDNTHDFEKGYDSVLFMIIFSGMMVVQIFFVMSGFLLMYSCLKFNGNVITWKMYLQLLLLRWSRLMPASGLSLAFSATWLRFLGSGPLWNMFITGGVVADCRRYWWVHVLYLNNYVPEDKFCELHTWYIAADFQLYAIGLIVYTASAAGGVRRGAALLVLLLAGMLAAAAKVWTHDLDGLPLLTPEFHRTFSGEEYHEMHVLGHINLPSYVLGMAAGITAHTVLKTQKMPGQGLRWAVVAAGRWWPPLVAALLWSGSVFYSAQPRWLHVLYAATHRAALGAIVAGAFIAAVLRFRVPLLGLLRWRGWVVWSRLSYCMFLIHVNLILGLISIKTQVDHANMYRVVIFHLGIVSLSALLALPLHLLVEVPFKNLITSHILTTKDHFRSSEQKSMNKKID